MQAMSTLLFVALLATSIQQLFRRESEPTNRCVDSRPVLRQKLLPLGLQQQLARTIVDVHPSAAFLLDELLVDELLVRLQNGDRIEPVFGGDVAHRGKR